MESNYPENLHSSIKRYRQLNLPFAEHISEGLCLTDGDGTVVGYNAAFLELVKLAHQAVDQQLLVELIAMLTGSEVSRIAQELSNPPFPKEFNFKGLREKIWLHQPYPIVLQGVEHFVYLFSRVNDPEGLASKDQAWKRTGEPSLERSTVQKHEIMHFAEGYSGEARWGSNMHHLLIKILDHLSQVIPYDSATFFLLENGTLVAVGGKSLPHPEKVIGHRFPADNALFVEIQKNAKPLILEDAQADTRYANWGGSTYVHGWMGIPLILDEHVIGYLTCDSRQTGKYTTKDAMLAQAFANQAAIAIENTRLLALEHHRLNALETIRRISLNLTSSLELTQVLKSILEGALNLLPHAHNSHIFLYNTDGQEKLSFGAALSHAGFLDRPFSEPRQNGITYNVARKGQTIVIPDMRHHPLFADTPKSWSGAIIGLPLKIGNRVVGVMNISFNEPRQIPEEELGLLQLLADQAAIAIENARLFEQSSKERRHIGLLYDINRELSHSLEPDKIMQSAVTLTAQALGGLVGEAFLYVPEEDHLTLNALYVGEAEPSSSRDKKLILQLGVGMAGWVAQHRQVINLPDVSQDARWIFIPGIDEHVQSAVCAPILAGETLLGVISVLHKDKGAFSSEHVTLLEAICREVALALSNAQRYQQIQRRLSEMTLIQNLTQAFTQRLEIQALLEEVVNQLQMCLGYEHVAIFALDGLIITHQAWSGVNAEAGNHLLAGEKIAQLQIERLDHPVWGSIHPNQVEAEDIPLATELIVPIRRNMETIGLIYVSNTDTSPIAQQDVELLKILSGQVAVALENAELYEQVRAYAGQLEHTVQQRTAELAALYQLSQQMSFSLSPEELLKLLLSHIYKAVPCDMVIGCLIIQGRHQLCILTRRPLAEGLLSKTLPDWIAEVARSAGKQISAEECHWDIQWFDEEGSFTEIQTLRSVIHAPIFIQNEFAGLLAAACEEEGTFTPAQDQLLTTVANQASASAQHLADLLAVQQQQLQSLIEQLPVGVVLLDANEHILVVNPLGREYLSALNAAVPEGQMQLPHLGPIALHSQLQQEGDTMPREISVEGPPKRTFTIATRAIHNPMVASPTYLLAIHEVTQEREYQARMQIQERLATVGQLAAGIAHDFNNIMAAILVYTDLLMYETSLSPKSQEKLSIIQQQVLRASSLIRQILDFSRKSVLEASLFDLLPFMKELEKIFNRVLPETIHLEFTYDPGSYILKADPTRLQQVFMNLATNARDAMPQGGTLKLGLAKFKLAPFSTPPIPQMPPGDYIRISISDTGIGIPPENRKHIFEPFFTTKPPGEGTGLGLAQVYGIVKQHDGFIDFSSKPGEGSTFIVYLPEVQAEGHQEDHPKLFDQLEGKGHTVLIVEDDSATRQALQTLMEAQGYQTITAPNGATALKKLEEAQAVISLVISDLVMPEMGGMQLYEVLRTRDANLKVLFITGHPLDETVRSRLGEGQFHWLQKPFSAQELNRVIRELLDEERGE